MLRALKFLGLLLTNVLVAVVGTAVLETAIGKVIPVRSLGAILIKEWSLSVIFAGCIGFGMWRTWRSEAAKWTWLIPGLWFAFRFLAAAAGNGTVWSQFSGVGCADGVGALGCRSFFVFTIPFIRGVSYSVGAYVSSLVYGRKGRFEVEVALSPPPQLVTDRLAGPVLPESKAPQG